MALTTMPPSPKEAHGLHLCLAGKVLKQLVVLLSLRSPVFLCYPKVLGPSH